MKFLKCMAGLLIFTAASGVHSQEARDLTDNGIRNLIILSEEIIVGSSSEPIAYAHTFRNDAFAGTRPSERIIFAPGFKLNIDPNETPIDAGTNVSAIELFKSLDTDQVPLPDGSRQTTRYIDYLVNGYGYSVSVIDYVDKTTSVRVNSNALQEYLTNPRFGVSFTPRRNYLFGYSMGGIIARHALVSIENSGQDHNIGAYVSLDAPHRGAFIPPSAQAVLRTVHTMSKNVGEVHRPLGRSVAALNSRGAKELLGIYMSQAIPRKLTKIGDKTSGTYKNVKSAYGLMSSDHFNAPHPSYFALREEMVDRGGYPSRSLNIGASFATVEGNPLRALGARPREVVNFKLDFQAHVRAGVTVLRTKYRTPGPQALCFTDFIAKSSRYCPQLDLSAGHLKNVMISPGSTIPIYKGIREDAIGREGVKNSFQEILNVVGLLPALRVSELAAQSSEDWTTFIPLVSAWDIAEDPYSYRPSTDPVVDSSAPFDVLIAAQGQWNGMHSAVPWNVRVGIQQTLIARDPGAGVPDRTGTVTSPMYYSNGDFRTDIYTSRFSEDELPIVSTGRTVQRMIPGTPAFAPNLEDTPAYMAAVL